MSAMVRQIKAGTTDVSVVLRILDSTDGTPETGVVFNTAGIALEYRRELAASVAITEVTLAALTTAHTDGGVLHIGNGYYRLDLPDAACAAGATGVLVHGIVTGMVVVGVYIDLGQAPADVTHWLGTAAATPTVAGVPEVDVTHWIGTAAATPTVAGVPEVDVTHWIGTAAATPTVAGVPEVDVTHWIGTAAATPTVAGVPEVDVTYWNGTAVPAENTAGYPIVTVKDGTGTGEIDTTSGGVLVSMLATQAKADVNAEVLDVLNVDTFAEPGQETPAATNTIVRKIGYIFKAWRNRSTQTIAEYALYNDDATTKAQEAVVSDNGTTFERGEISTGA